MSPRPLVVLDAATAEQSAHEAERLEAPFKSDIGLKAVESALADWYCVSGRFSLLGNHMLILCTVYRQSKQPSRSR